MDYMWEVNDLLFCFIWPIWPKSDNMWYDDYLCMKAMVWGEMWLNFIMMPRIGEMHDIFYSHSFAVIIFWFLIITNQFGHTLIRFHLSISEFYCIQFSNDFSWLVYFVLYYAKNSISFSVLFRASQIQ